MTSLALTQTRHRVDFTPFFMCRTSGLPYDVVHGLESPDLSQWASQVLAMEVELVEAEVALNQALEAAIGGNEDQENRRALLRLRRTVHKLAAPEEPLEALKAVERHGLTQQVAQWCALSDRYKDLIVEGDSLVRADEAASSQYLAEVADRREVRGALVLANPRMESELDAFARMSMDERSKKRARRQWRTLLTYVYRAACKTSPFSTLTPVSLGHFDFAQSLARASGTGTLRSKVRLNVALLSRITESLRTHQWCSADLPVALVAGWEMKAERLRYMRRHRVVDNSETRMTLDRMAESVFYLSAGEIMQSLIAVLDARPNLTLAVLEEELNAKLALQATKDDIHRFLATLTRLDLLTTPALAVDIHADDPFERYAEGLLSIGSTWADRLAEDLRAINRLAKDTAEQEPRTRRMTIAEIQRRLVDVFKALDVDSAALPTTLLYEDATTPELQIVLSKELWNTSVAEDLARFASILEVFDVLAPQRILLKGFFLARFKANGECTDFVKFVSDFHLDLFDEYLKTTTGPPEIEPDGMPSAPPNWLDMPEIDAIHAARVELVKRMRAAYSQHDGGDMSLDAGFFHAISAHLPTVQGSDHRSFFVQIAGSDPGRVVMNQTYSGLGLMFSRFLHCLDDQASDSVNASSLVTERLRSQQPKGTVFAEMTGGVDSTNLNLHPAVTPYEIVCPGEVSSRPADQQIAASSLRVRHCTETDELYLYSPHLDKRVIPVYLGYLMPLMLPELQRVLLMFTTNRMAQLDMWTGTDQPLGDRVIASHPRLCHGSLVLVRETWKTNPAKLPQRRFFPNAAQWYLAWQRFRSEHGLPRYVFATLNVGSEPDDSEADNKEVVAGLGKAKPQYIDFESLSCLWLLDEMIKQQTSRLVFQEMLPTPDDLWLADAAGRYISEQTVEVRFDQENE